MYMLAIWHNISLVAVLSPACSQWLNRLQSNPEKARCCCRRQSSSCCRLRPAFRHKIDWRLGFTSLTNHLYQPSSDDARFRMRKCLARCTSRPNPCDAAGKASSATCTSVGARKWTLRYITTSKSKLVGTNWRLNQQTHYFKYETHIVVLQQIHLTQQTHYFKYEILHNRYINRLFEPSSHADGSCRIRLWA